MKTYSMLYFSSQVLRWIVLMILMLQYMSLGEMRDERTNQQKQSNGTDWSQKQGLVTEKVEIKSNPKHEINTTKWNEMISKEHSNITKVLDGLLDNYDARLRPNFDGLPVVVQIGIWVLSLDSINVIDMEYSLDFYLRQLWVDPRLAHKQNKVLTLSNALLKKIWLPDTYFSNAKQSKFHQVTAENKMLSIDGDGNIHYNVRISVSASCQMNLINFPLDRQQCGLSIESYGYSEKEIMFKWEERDDGGVAIPTEIRELPQYNLTGVTTSTARTAYVAGNWSSLIAQFNLVRRTGYFVIHVFAPCALIVMISWISFCIPPDSTAARVGLGITSVLTITTILNMLNTTMPKVSYVKAVDWYLIGCFLFVFGVCAEYTLVLYIGNLQRRYQRLLKRRKEAEKVKVADQKSRQHKNSLPNGYSPLVQQCSGKEYGQSSIHIAKKSHSYFGAAFNCFGPSAKNSHNSKNNVTNHHSTDENISAFKRWYLDIDVETIDDYARLLFPSLFILFNVVYYSVFVLSKSS